MSKGATIYLNLCAQVYDIRVNTVEKEVYEFYKSFVKDANGLILEPMCGTGRFLLPLLLEGFSIEGYDASSHMLEVLYRKAKEKDIIPTVWQAFAENFIQDKKYNLIFIPFSSFGLITNLENAKKTLLNFFNELNFEGKLVFEIDTPITPSHIGPDRISLYELNDEQIIKVTSSDLPTTQNNILNCKVKYDLFKENSPIHSEIENYSLRLYHPQEIKKILEEIGFCNIIFHKAFERNISPKNYDETIVVECKKS